MSTEDSKPSSAALCEKVPTEEECEKHIKLSESPTSGTLNVPPEAAAAAPQDSTPSTNMDSRQTRRSDSGLSDEALEKKTFLLFVKILFKLLKEQQGDEFTNRAKRVVMECRRHNQQNHPGFIPLMEALERHLRLLVGDKIWARAHFYLSHYLSKQQQEQEAMGIEARPSAVSV